jgi:RNA polymerase sigma factor (sigma-70 family)
VRSLYPILRYVRRLFRPGDPGVTDAELLQRFVAGRDEAAFELLVWRHGPMVLGVCKRILHDEHAAEDAFQATFVALARAAGSLGGIQSVGGWLYTVATRTARRARARAGRRALVEQPLGDRPVAARGGDPGDAAAQKDLRRLLDAEVARLPEKYRAAFVLCYLEGKTNEEAAEQLGCPKGTVLSRLARARERLRERLADHGFLLGAVPFAQFLLDNPLELAKVSPVLVNATVHLSLLAAMGKLLAGSAASAAGEVLRTTVSRVCIMQAKILAAVLALGILTAGAGVYALNTLTPAPGDGGEPTAVQPTDPGEGAPACPAKAGCCH